MKKIIYLILLMTLFLSLSVSAMYSCKRADINKDGEVYMDDFMLLIDHLDPVTLESCRGHELYHVRYDINRDGCINMYDVDMINYFYGACH